MHPILERTKDLPDNILCIVAGIDIVTHEQLTFVERVKAELNSNGQPTSKRTVEAVVFDNAFHGWFERKYGTCLCCKGTLTLPQCRICPKTCTRTR